ncbi:hypothetical protein RND71_032208 [Anisodus tanguticus]|uniref:Uncharacterized protein n=1 Tax=Anisodus tanguticus TaxID=243964 RepID=A0AAE1RDA1_9SOLA|nr:hypothetical protein RND71_032208 [Anisodus tanguticus]
MLEFQIHNQMIIVMVRLVDECELEIHVTNIVHNSESYFIDVEADTDCDSANESLNSPSNESSDDDFDSTYTNFNQLEDLNSGNMKSHDIEPPEMCKMVGRPKVKRGRVRNENLKRQGEWSASRKGKPITCSKCHQSGHNARGYDKASKGKQAVVKRFKGSYNTTALESEENFPSISTTTVLEPDKFFQSSNTLTVLEPEPSLRPKSFSKANTRILERMKQRLATPTRKISFVDDSTAMSQPTNMPYQPTNKTLVTREKMKIRKRNVMSQI